MLRLVYAFTLCAPLVVSAQAFAVASFSQDATRELSDEIVLTSDTVFQVPFGNSVTGAFTVPAVDVRAGTLRVYLEGAACGATATGVRFTTLFNQRSWQTMLVERDGSFSYDARRFYYLQFDLIQTRYNFGSCTFKLVIGATDGGGNDGELLGVIQYDGGYANRLSLELDSPTLVNGFRLAMPGFCGLAEILEAGTISEGFFDRAVARRQEHSFSVNGGAGLRVSAIEVTLNGPSDASCTIPVYATR